MIVGAEQIIPFTNAPYREEGIPEKRCRGIRVTSRNRRYEEVEVLKRMAKGMLLEGKDY